ncbi:hypothetical protein C8R42DRAFT_729157 [Lentinula raphanica]|nr:hypothetical protein C8R42DRAFT_729157 [Lentinula raphanica]
MDDNNTLITQTDTAEEEDSNETQLRSRNQRAADRKRARRRKLDEELPQQERQKRQHLEDIQAQIDASVEEQVQLQRKSMVAETMKQHKIIEELRDEILQRDKDFDTHVWERLQKFLHKYLGIHVPIYPTKPGAHEVYIKILKELEQRRRTSLDSDDPRFPKELTTSVYDAGLHIGVDEDSLDFLWQVKITPWEDFLHDERENIQSAIKIMMDFTYSAPLVTLNGSQTLSKDKSRRTHEQEEDVATTDFRRSGKMWAAGWHGTRGERNVDLSRYSVRRDGSVVNRTKLLGEYTRTSEGFPFVGEQYAYRLSLLFPHEYRRLCNFAIENHIPSFAD